MLPDLDALTRVFGKIAFLRCHQTWTHAFPLIVAVVILSWPIPGWLGTMEQWAPLAIGAGMVLHSLMDATNTYGVALLAPFVRRRYCTEWVFFIDAVVLAVTCTLLAIMVVSQLQAKPVSVHLAAGYAVFLAGYWLLKWAICRRAWHLCVAGTRHLIPSAFLPWRFHGLAIANQAAQLFELNAFNGQVKNLACQEILDHRFNDWLATIPEYRLMSELTPGYHVVAAREDKDHVTLTCRDLRIRNFGGSFGLLEVAFDREGIATRKDFHV